MCIASGSILKARELRGTGGNKGIMSNRFGELRSLQSQTVKAVYKKTDVRKNKKSINIFEFIGVSFYCHVRLQEAHSKQFKKLEVAPFDGW